MTSCFFRYYIIFYLVIFINYACHGSSLNKINQPQLLSECKGLDKICPRLELKSDLDILECVQFSDTPNNIDQNCLSNVWKFAATLLNYQNMLELLDPHCQSEVVSLPCNSREQPGALLKCAIENISQIKRKDCKTYVERLRFLTFLDARAMNLFIEECNDDVAKYNCEFDRNPEVTLSCLQKYLLKLKKACQTQVLRLSELQAENVKYDKQLLTKCASERRLFCEDVSMGSGQVYECLFRHKDEQRMSPQCASELLRHEQLIVQDYQVSRGLVRACKEDIKNNRCRKSVSDDRDIRLAQILLCLENATHYGKIISIIVFCIFKQKIFFFNR
uniref:Uncharacterized protein n=1 Tax=Rhodnius prolixus TaxID=13249 RepID=T1H7V1_RHOPR